jgi:hypothetical protein
MGVLSPTPSKSRVMMAAFADGTASKAVTAMRVFMLQTFVKGIGK